MARCVQSRIIMGIDIDEVIFVRLKVMWTSWGGSIKIMPNLGLSNE